MKQEIEQIIKNNLPEKKGKYSQYNESATFGFNQALSQINTSLITDEVLKVVVEVGKEEIKRVNDMIPNPKDYEQGYIRGFKEYIHLLSNLSTIKENK